MGEESVVGLIISAGIVQEVDPTPTYTVYALGENKTIT